MRLLNIFAALSGALALAMLAVAHHALAADPDVSFVYLAAGAQLAAAAAGLALANRTGRLNLICGALIVGGAALFAGVIYLGAFRFHAVHALAPIGGGAMILGWVGLAFAKPGT
jgi:uncharacterized membrane protein YgdD (TMEM256/DUF423 family)